MKRTHVNYAVATVLLAMLALAGCNKSEEPTPPSVTATPAATPPPATTPAPSTPGPMTPAQSTPGANVAITSVDLGNAVGQAVAEGEPGLIFGVDIARHGEPLRHLFDHVTFASGHIVIAHI